MCKIPGGGMASGSFLTVADLSREHQVTFSQLIIFFIILLLINSNMFRICCYDARGQYPLLNVLSINFVFNVEKNAKCPIEVFFWCW